MARTRKNSTAGSRFKASIEGVFDLDSAGPAWAAMLDQTAALMDMVERLEAEVDGNLTVEGSQGQPVSNPLLAALLKHRVELVRLLGRLGVDETGESQSDRQRRIANRRWSK